MKFLCYGKGWIGSQLDQLLHQAGDEVIWGLSRVDDTKSVRLEIQTQTPDRVICLVGRTHGNLQDSAGGTGVTTIDYLEQPGKLIENVRDNLFAPISLALLCQELGIHFTFLNTGCIFSYDDLHTVENQVGFTEEDAPNFFGSSYSVVKGFTDRLMHQIPGCTLRLRMPITADRHPRNFITKITSYAKICSIPNAMSVLPTLLPILVDLSRREYQGVLNFTNPGLISHNEILELYREIVDPQFHWENFSLEEQAQVLKAARSNNCLDTTKLQALYPDLPPIREAVRACLVEMAKDTSRE